MSDELNPGPNRTPQLTVANSDTNARLAPVQPAAGAILPQWAVLTLTVLTVAAGVVVMIPGMPPTVIAIAGGVTALGAALGIASPGIRRQQ